jgi:hypothetical protein
MTLSPVNGMRDGRHVEAARGGKSRRASGPAVESRTGQSQQADVAPSDLAGNHRVMLAPERATTSNLRRS